MIKHNHQASQHHIQYNLQCNHHMDIDHLLPMQFEGRYQFAVVDGQRSVRPILIINLRFCPPTQTPTQTLKYGFFIFGSQEKDSGLVLFQVIFEALQFELLSFKFHTPSSKILKIPEVNLHIYIT